MVTRPLRPAGWTSRHLRHIAGIFRQGHNPAARVYESIGPDFFLAPAPGWLNLAPRIRSAPDLNPAEGIWSLLKRSMANFAAADQASMVRIIKRKLKKIQYRPHLINGCLAATGLQIEPW